MKNEIAKAVYETALKHDMTGPEVAACIIASLASLELNIASDNGWDIKQIRDSIDLEISNARFRVSIQENETQSTPAE